jgi:quinolinate synthase
MNGIEQNPPREYLSFSADDLIERIRAEKKKADGKTTILGHHYQAAEIVRLSDFVGDSFQLCQDATKCDADNIVFCGVRFMAESARVVARPEQTVQHPESRAGCPMADMADLPQVEEAWKRLAELQAGRTIIPVTYMNSSVELKAFCGKHGGIVCTSSNASKVFDWAYTRGATILFFPDEHLGTNTALDRGMDPDMIAVWNPGLHDQQEDKGKLATAPLIVWKGFCHVHTHFTVADIESARANNPDAHVIVHPECPHPVVAAADSNGSTKAIVNKVAQAKPGETIVIGTEVNLVHRLNQEYPSVNVLPLAPSICGNMAKITLPGLLWTLENPKAGIVTLDDDIVNYAREALERMLSLA